MDAEAILKEKAEELRKMAGEEYKSFIKNLDLAVEIQQWEGRVIDDVKAAGGGRIPEVNLPAPQLHGIVMLLRAINLLDDRTGGALVLQVLSTMGVLFRLGQLHGAGLYDLSKPSPVNLDDEEEKQKLAKLVSRAFNDPLHTECDHDGEEDGIGVAAFVVR